MPADELPTRQAVWRSSDTNSSTGTLVMNRICSVSSRVLLAHVAEAAGHFAGAGIGIGPEPDRRHARRRDRVQRLWIVLAVVALGRHRMLNDDQERLREVDAHARRRSR